MDERNSAENLLKDQTKFRLNKINKIKDYFNSEIQERKKISKKLSKYIAVFDYIDNCSICNVWRNKYHFYHNCYWSSFTLVFSLTTGIIKKLLKITKKKKKKHNKTVMLAKSKLNSKETLISQALIGLDISHKEFKSIVNEKEKYEQMKESITNKKSRDELSENNKENRENAWI